MTEEPFAPLGRFIDGSRSRKCGHSPGDTPNTDCPTDATWHIMWNTSAEVSLACEQHMTRARRFVFLDSHRIGPDCDMPGARWDLDNKRCVYPDEPAAETAAAVHGAAVDYADRLIEAMDEAKAAGLPAGVREVRIVVQAPTDENAGQWAETIRDLVVAEYGESMRLDVTISPEVR